MDTPLNSSLHSYGEQSLSSGSVSSDFEERLSSSASSVISSVDSSHGRIEPELDGDQTEPIAICGFSIKFPQDADSAEGLWRMMCEKRCAMTDFPENRFNLKGFHNGKNKRNTIPNRGAHFIKEDLDAFDAEFFSISPAEAASMDPTQRWLLEAAYRAMENAGMTMEQLSGSSTSVFTGSFGLDWMVHLCRDAEQPPMYAASGFGLSMLANRISWYFNLLGPSIGLDSACSSSAMALDIACQSLRNRSCDASLVCGANLTFAPEAYTWMSNIQFLSPDSRCQSFDHRANGYARGEGIGVLVIKRLSDAIRDGNTIRAVIRSTGSNEDGRTPGITQPSRTAQERLIRATYQKAGLSLAHTRYFEAHGTGTAIGDPREALAIGTAFQKYRSNEDPVYVGAVKSNIGHLEGASGLAGVIKAVLVLERAVIPPNSNFEKVNPKIDVDYLRIKFPTQCVPWPSAGLRRASINSFGYGGANSHIVLDDAYNYLRLRNLQGKHCTVSRPPDARSLIGSFVSGPSQSDISPDTSSEFRPKLLILSAPDRESVKRLCTVYQQHVRSLDLKDSSVSQYLNDLACTLNDHRTRFSWGTYFVADSTHFPFDFNPTALRAPSRVRKTPLRTGFVFTGQGAQWSGMGKELMQHNTFKASVSRAQHYLEQLGCTWSLTDQFLSISDPEKIHHPEYSQIVCTVLQVALVDLLRHVKIMPAAVVGHSSGEIAAAYAAGHISCESAWRLAYFRGILSCKLAGTSEARRQGAMLAVGLSETGVKPYVLELNSSAEAYGLTIACINSPESVTISGEENLIDQLKQQIDKTKVFARKLRVPLAYHSRQMEEIADEYVSMIGTLTSGSTPTETASMISSVTEGPITADESLNPRYWAQNLTSPVRFCGAVLNLCAADETLLTKKIDGSHRSAIVVNHLLEVGPHSALQGPIREILQKSARGQSIGYSSVLKRQKAAMDTFLQIVGDYWCTGHDVSLSSANGLDSSPEDKGTLLVDLPEYPFDHSQKYWFESRLSKNYRLREHAPKDFLGTRSNDWNPDDARWRNCLDISDLPWIQHHQVNDNVIFPGAGMLVMVLEAAHELFGADENTNGYHLRDVTFESAMDFSASSGQLETQVHLERQKRELSRSPSFKFTVYSGSNGSWGRNCYGQLTLDVRSDKDEWVQDEEATVKMEMASTCAKVASRCSAYVETERMYDFVKRSGINFGPSFRAARKQYISSRNEVSTEISLFPPPGTDDDGTQPQVIHPVSFDAMLHICFTALSNGGSNPMATSVPSSVGYMWISKTGLTRSVTDSVNAVCFGIERTTRGFTANCAVVDQSQPSQIRMFAEDMQLTNITAMPTDIDQPEAEQSYFNLVTEIALNKLDNPEIQSLLNAEALQTYDTPNFIEELSIVQEICLERLLASVDSSQRRESDSWQYHYLQWAQHHLNTRKQLYSEKEYRAKFMTITKNFDEVCHRLGRSNARGRLFVEVAKNLQAVYEGTKDPLNILFDNDLANLYYNEVSDRYARHLARYVSLLAHQTPGLRILEVGRGTGCGTRICVNALKSLPDGNVGDLRCDRYDFTDVSSSFFDGIRKEFSDDLAQIKFKVLDIEHDFVAQGLEENAYDLVVAVSVLHVTSDITKVLKNARRSLRTGGKLIVWESFSPASWHLGFVFGLFPGWWLGREDGRCLSPHLSLESWDDRLRQAGFSGNELVVHDYNDQVCHDPGIIISTAVDKATTPSLLANPLFSVKIVVQKHEQLQQLLTEGVATSISQNLGLPCTISTLEEVCHLADLSADYVVLLANYGGCLLETPTKSSWGLLKTLMSKVKHLLWVARGADSNKESPGYGLADGLTRVLRSENYDLHLVTLLLESSVINSQAAGHLSRVVEEMVSMRPHQNYEQEYLEINGMLHVRRVVNALDMKKRMLDQLVPSQDVEVQVKDAAPFKVQPCQTGQSPSITYTAATREPVSANEVEILVKAVSINRADVLAVSGLKHDAGIGRLCAGVVSKPGKNTQLLLGDRVVAIGNDCFRSHLRVRADQVVRLADKVSFTEACAAMPAVMTAHYALFETARLQQQDTVLVHHGASPLGRAAIEICQRLGVLEVLATASSSEERDAILQYSSLRNEVVLHHNSFDRRVRHVSRKGAVDIEIVPESATASPPPSLKHLLPFGRSITIQMEDQSRATASINLVSSNVTVSTVDIQTLQEICPLKLLESLRYTADHVATVRNANHEVKVPVFTVSEVTEATRVLQSAKPSSTAVINLEDDALVKIRTKSGRSCAMDEHATYVVVGGLGGIGREITRWLVGRGARNLILLSRSGAHTVEALQMITKMRAQGVRVETPSADVAELNTLKRVLDDCATRLPPVKGCIHTAMILNDIIFPNMQLQQWTSTVEVKAKGAWNLHNLLPTGLDFFIMISSMQGIAGRASCGNYAAANTYLDALARHRIANGECAASICLGAISDAGYLTDHTELLDRLDTMKVFTKMSKKHVYALMDIYCEPNTPLSRSSTSCQPIMGIVPPAEALANGAELPFTMYQPLWQHLHHVPVENNAHDVNGVGSSDNNAIIPVFDMTANAGESAAIISASLRQRITTMLGMTSDRLDDQEPLQSYGIDSLIAIDLRNWIAKTFGADIAVFEILNGVSMAHVAGRIVKFLEKQGEE